VKTILLSLSLLLVLVPRSSAQEHRYSIGCSLHPCSSFYFAGEDSVPLLHSPFHSGGLFSSCSVWLSRYRNDFSLARLEMGFWTSIVPGSDPGWVFDEYYTGTEHAVLATSAAFKNYNLLPFGLGIGYGVGISSDWLALATWDHGVCSTERATSVDLVFPIEFIYLYKRRFQISIHYIPSFVRLINEKIVLSYSHLLSLGIGCHHDVRIRYPARCASGGRAAGRSRSRPEKRRVET
jgi:hypothetical protein